MAPTPKSSEITLSDIQSLLPRYKILLRHLLMRDVEKKRKAGGDLTEILTLDRFRYSEFPSRVQERKRDSGEAWLEKRELEFLMSWKLKHGKFRPQLPALIASNPPDLVESTTKEAFAVYSASNPPESSTAISQLCKLKGVGPATASLLLSVHDPTNAPFFSDELLRWICWDEKAGWGRKIKYDAKEYRMLSAGVQALRERLGGGAEGADGKGVQAVELEKVAYVLGRCAAESKLAAAIEEDGARGDGVEGEGERSREVSPPPSKRAKLGEDVVSKSRAGQGTDMGEGEKTAEEAEEAGGRAVALTPPESSTRADAAKSGDGSTRRTSRRITRGRSGGKLNDKAGAIPSKKRKRKSKSDNS